MLNTILATSLKHAAKRDVILSFGLNLQERVNPASEVTVPPLKLTMT